MPRILHLIGTLMLPILMAAQGTRPVTRPLLTIATEHGDMIVALYNETPIHRDNFLKRASEGAYDGLLFHRVVPGLIVLGGDPASRNATDETPLGREDTTGTLPAEIVPGLVHVKGALGAARLPDEENPDRRSSPQQFYIVLGRSYQPKELDLVAERNARYEPDAPRVRYTEEQHLTFATEGGAPHLDGGYTVFGQVIEGLDVLDKLAAEPCDAQDRPVKDQPMWIRPMP